ncbi:V-type ATP synthase subunit A [Methylobacter sp. S3L5C]|uniref:V-type ATP synthase subunit A n=1 Tax=Methylobacter sp. S3L5C TaxID=2839024 RepID=UPI001FABADBF|nr:V-type ATP synthase subunit A [Methylobacter sp. S3L5C]UOA09816.1 V-type ATP synthase subunit A [Methylobacter sp. S3L5C]
MTAEQPISRTAKIIGVLESLVLIEVDENTSLMKNELGYVCVGNERLKAEVLRVRRRTADMQVFEDTRGVKVGDTVELTGEMLSAVLGPGLLGQVFDGLLNPLHTLADKYGFFLPRGITMPPLDPEKKWHFEPGVAVGARVSPGGAIGTVPEGQFKHKIMVPFNEPEPVEITWIRGGNLQVEDVIARYKTSKGTELEMTMSQRWAVRKPMPESLIRRHYAERLYPTEPITTATRIIDTFFPIAQGGTGCIPGPFGAGKTVLQSLIARFSTVDIVVIVACGERAGEVVETLTEYPETTDPRTGGTLMDRTIIICNTSSMPVAAREASIYTGITLGEYFRQMGYHVLLIADSTSRWAQAMRETSGRMEEIPGEEAFPAYLDSSVKNVYERAGVLRCPDGSTGSLTMIGTVSPAGGNFEEPVTQATLGTVKTFLGLSADRAYRRFYPAIDPLISWSRYLDQLAAWFTENIDVNWVRDVKSMQELLVQGDGIYQMMQVTGEEGITEEDFIVWQKSLLLDMVYLQQDAFDSIDACMSRERQLESFRLLKSLIDTGYRFKDKDEGRSFFTELTSHYRNWNYSAPGSTEFDRYRKEIVDLAAQYGYIASLAT